MKKAKKGFTLIEILVVITIIGILSGIIVIRLDTVRAKARDHERISDISTLQLALAMYVNKNGTYPTSLSSLAPVYIFEVPKDPKTHADYKYAALGSGTICLVSGYHLGTKLESNDPLLSADADFNSSAVSVCGGSGFDGSDGSEYIYDVKK